MYLQIRYYFFMIAFALGTQSRGAFRLFCVDVHRKWTVKRYRKATFLEILLFNEFYSDTFLLFSNLT